MTEKDDYLLSSLDNALKITDVLSHYSALSFSAICKETKFSKASVFRMLYTLEKNKYVEKNEDGSYSLGVKFLYYNNIVSSRHDVYNTSRPFLAGLALKTKLSTHLSILRENRVITILQETSPYGLSVVSRIGTNAAAHSTAMGRVLLSYLPEEGLDSYLEHVTFKKYSPNSILTADQLRASLADYKKKGYATDCNDRYPNYAGLATPIFDYTHQCIASIGVIVPASELKAAIRDHLAQLQETSQAISAAMGYYESTVK